jgi:dTDP-4-amino-4,6-dideoxy-D-glucose ammonia-lyase
MSPRPTVADDVTVIETCASPSADPAAAGSALRRVLRTASGTPELLVRLARIYGHEPFTPLERARSLLGCDRAEFAGLLATYATVPALRTAVTSSPAGKYWTNTIFPLEADGVLDDALRGRPRFPHIVGLYPGPTCMFRCHFCVRVTGARYRGDALGHGTDLLASVIDEMPTHNPHAMYLSGGLEPLTNPRTGELVARAAGRGLALTLYTNSFALTEQTLNRQPGLWRLHALRTSLYGLNEEEYQATTGKRGYQRVKDNLRRFQRLRAERDEPVRLGLNYIILPGRADRLAALLDYLEELTEAAPDRPVDFLNVREDYSGRDDGRLADAERDELTAALSDFHEQAARRLPALAVDYGYALESLRAGVPAQLPRIRPDTMRPGGHPQVAVQIDLLGDVYLYREAGFPDLPGATRYVAGRIGSGLGLHDVVARFVESGAAVVPADGDEYFLDGFDQVVTARLRQLETDVADGWAEARGFLR